MYDEITGASGLIFHPRDNSPAADTNNDLVLGCLLFLDCY